jgi:DNA-binding NarL/FixJ family response regulator
MARFSVLVVDDFGPWRELVVYIVEKVTDCYVAGEASDGVEAVQKAESLKPDLVLLDLGLPKMNGLEAARQIRDLAPLSKILFLTQESSPEVAREAMKVGTGFVVKTDAAAELLPAVNTVILGEQFLSSQLQKRNEQR